MSPTTSKPIVIGLVGGVASGKSSVAHEFAALGAEVIDADKVGHEALEDPNNKRAIVALFGEKVLASNAIDRRVLGSLVFQDPKQLEELTKITHPWISATIRARLNALLAQDTLPAIILDVSLLLESGNYEEDLDYVFFIEGPKDERNRRAVANRGWSEDELARREASQLPLEEKRARADAVIDNSGAPAALREEIEALWRKYVTPAIHD